MAAPAVTVDASGIFAPPYLDWLTYLQDSYRGLYGADIYIEADSQDGQFLALLAQALYDAGNSAVATYNDFSPATAQGAGLSSVVKVDGIRRQIATNSTAVVTLVGQPGVTTSNGVIGDNLSLGTRWSVPSVTFPGGGSVNVTAVCQTPGNVTAGPGTLTAIITPQPGWQTVTNALAAAPGAPVETDAALRRRQSRSASLPADTTLNGIFAAVANVLGVQRVAVYQNDTTVTDANTLPPRTISVVVEGGNSGEVAAAIALKKPPGIPTYGDITVIVVDSRGVPDGINYFPLRLDNIYTLVFLTALQGYVTGTSDAIKASLAEFYTDAPIGNDAYLTRAYAPANLTGEAAQLATGMTQQQLDALSNTYHVTKMAQADEDMHAVGTFGAGSTTITALVTFDYSVGQTVYLSLDDLSYFKVLLTGVVQGVMGTITFTPAVPVGRSVVNGAKIYLEGDVQLNFNESSIGAAANVTVVVS